MGQKSIIVNTPNKKNHSDAQDWAAVFNGLYGGNTGILPIGSKLVVGVNEEFVIINDGVFSLDGHMLRVKDGTKQFLKLPETEVGKKRIAYVVAQYVVNTKLEDDTLEFAILAGEQDAINPLPPQVTIGNIDKGDRLNQAIIAELLIDGKKAEVNRYGKKANLLPYINKIDENYDTELKKSIERIDHTLDGTRVFIAHYGVEKHDRTNGGCVDGNLYYGISVNKDDTSAMIRVIDINSLRLVRSKVLTDVGHANSAAIYKEHLYVVPSIIDGNRVKYLKVYNKNTLDFVKNIELGVLISGVSVDENGIYTMGNRSRYINMFNHDGVHIKDVILEKEIYHLGQSFNIANDKIYIVRSNPNFLYVFNLKNGKEIGVHELKERYNNYFVGEIEDITVNGEDIFIHSVHNPTGNLLYRNTQLFKFNLKNRKDSRDYPDHQENTVDSPQIVYVDGSVPEINNNFGTKEKPYKHIQEAINNHNGKGSIVVNPSSSTYLPFRMNRNWSLVLEGVSHPKIQSANILNSSSIRLQGVEFVDKLEIDSISNVIIRDCTTKDIDVGNGSSLSVYTPKRHYGLIRVWGGSTLVRQPSDVDDNLIEKIGKNNNVGEITLWKGEADKGDTVYEFNKNVSNSFERIKVYIKLETNNIIIREIPFNNSVTYKLDFSDLVTGGFAYIARIDMRLYNTSFKIMDKFQYDIMGSKFVTNKAKIVEVRGV